MQNSKSNVFVWTGILIAMVIAIVALSVALGGSSATPNYGGVTNYDEIDATAMKIGGASGSRLGPVISSTCSLIATTFTIAATTSVPMDCAVTGVVAGDMVFGQFASSTGAASAGWSITGAQASSTSGFVTFSVTNMTGASAVVPARLASSTDYLVLHPRSTIPGL